MKSKAAKIASKHSSRVSSRNRSRPFFQKHRSAEERSGINTQKAQVQLRFNKPQDHFEQQADAVADRVVEGRSLTLSNGPGQSAEGGIFSQITPLAIARKEEQKEEREAQLQAQVEEEEEPLQAKADPEEKEDKREKVQSKAEGDSAKQEEEEKVQARSAAEPSADQEEEKKRLQRQAEEEEEKLQQQAEKEEKEPLQRRAATPLPGINSGPIEPVLRASKGKGSPLPTAVRSSMEKSFAADFSGVRIHTDETAVTLSRRLRAQAFTHGRDIYFNQNKFSPASRQGSHLLAHELTHTIQQGKVAPQPAPKVQSQLEPPLEEEREVQAKAETASQSPAPPVIQRSFLDSLTGAAGVVWDATGGQLVDAAGQVVEMTAEMFWSLLERVAPTLVPLVREISSKGILGFLKEKVSLALSHIFDRLQNNDSLLAQLLSMYLEMAAQVADIVLALASGDCKPLFAAVQHLKEMLAKLAGDAWNAISDFFAPIGAFFSNLWQSFGAPVLDWLKQTAADIWAEISGLGQQLWAWTQPVRDAVGGAWSWLKDKLGLGGDAEGDSEGGLIQWIQGKAEQAWGFIKEELQPVIAPIQGVVEKVQAILPLEAIFNLRATIQGWLSKAEAMGQAMGEDGSNVAEQQTSLRDEILPAILTFIESVRLNLNLAGLWISDKIGAIVATVSGFMEALKSSPLLGGLQSAVSWIQTVMLQLTDWYRSSVQKVFNFVGDGLVYLASFVRPVLDILNQIVETLKNLMGKLPDLILGPVWWLLPDCIKNPIKDFILNQILMRIPLFQQFMSIGDIWAKVKNTALIILKQIFVDGNLFGALWTYFKAVLSIFGLPPQLITNIIVKAAQALGDIIANPIGFIINILKAVKEGFVRFFSNILKHLFSGVTDWLFGQIAEAGITIPKDFSLKSILGLVFEILGLSMAKIWQKLADKIGPDKVEKLKKGLKLATGVWEWIKLAATEGPAAVWAKVKEKLSDLWTSVLTGVVGWINQVIIVQGTKWLLSLLDVSGIMPTITATIALYKAIESFFAYLKKMLEIVNTVMNGIADLARGAIGTAAGFLESALAKSVPIVIGFLANQFGLGRLGSKLQEIIGAVQQKVDGAIDWLIEKAINLGKAFLDTLKSGVEAVKKWWLKSKKFTTKKGADHSLTTQEKGSGLDLIVQSEPVGIQVFIDTKRAGPPTPTDQQAQGLDKIQALYDTIKDTKYASFKQEAETGDSSQKIVDTQDAIAKLIVAHDLMDLGGATEYPTPNISLQQTSIKHPDFAAIAAVDAETITPEQKLAKKEQLAKSKSISTTVGAHSVGSLLSLAKGNMTGSEPSSNANLPLFASLHRTDRHWVKGHLLNHQLGGPGSSENMTPITTGLNNEMKSLYENQIKKHVLEEAKVVDYSVTVQHGTHARFKEYQPQHYLSTNWNFTFKIKKFAVGSNPWIDDPASPGWTKATQDDLSHVPLTNEEINAKVAAADAAKTVAAQKDFIRNRLSELQGQISRLSSEVGGTFAATPSGAESARVIAELQQKLQKQQKQKGTAEQELKKLEEEHKTTTRKAEISGKIESKKGRIVQVQGWIDSTTQTLTEKQQSFAGRQASFDTREQEKQAELSNKQTVHQDFTLRLAGVDDNDSAENRAKLQTLRSELDAALKS